MISQETIAKVKNAANLIEVIGESVSLRRQGHNYVGLCPFHSEKSPSFIIKDTGESYYCFGCGAGGNVISYVMQTRGLTFPEAIEDLASRYGIEIVYERGKTGPTINSGQSEILYKINHTAAQFFKQSLSKAPALVQNYIKERNLDQRCRDAFLIGYIPDEWSSLSSFLLNKKFDPETIIKSGLAQRNQTGNIIDRFRGRIIFPIFIDPKRIAGFGGRIVPGLTDPEREKKAPKYLNSPETDIYKKSKILYGLPQASKMIRETGQVYLVEGYVDVVGLWRVGVENAVATCGTAVTEEHIKRISQLAKRLYVVFDGDEAGRSAAAKMFTVTVNSGIDVFAIFLDTDEDPDTFAEKHGSNTARALQLQRNIPLFECYLESLIQKFSRTDGVSTDSIPSARNLGAASKGKIAAEIASIISKVKNPIEQSVLLENAAAKLLIDTADFSNFVEKNKIVQNPSPQLVELSPEEDHVVALVSIKKLPRLDQELLRTVVVRKELINQALRHPVIGQGAHDTTLMFLDGLNKILEQDQPDGDKKAAVRTFLSTLGSDWLDFWKEAYKMAEDPMVKTNQLFGQCLLSYEKRQLKERVSRIELDMRESTEEAMKTQLAQEKLIVERRLKELSNR